VMARASVKRTNTRLLAGSNGMVPLPRTKIENVAVVLGFIAVVTLGSNAEMH